MLRLLLGQLVARGQPVAGPAVAYAAGTGKGASEVLFSGQAALGPFVAGRAGYTAAALLPLMACEGLALPSAPAINGNPGRVESRGPG